MKRSHDLAKAQAKSRFETPSTIESIIRMKEELGTKLTSLENLYRLIQKDYANYESLIKEWQIRLTAAEELFASLPKKAPNRPTVEHLAKVAKNHYEINVEGEYETRKKFEALNVSLQKIRETLEGLNSAERRYELNASLLRASEAVGERKLDFTEDEAEIVKRLAYSANALLALKEKDLMLPEVQTNIKSITMEQEFKKIEGA
ncbi:MAG: hypothetical protein H9W81_02510 [Enterococcus sp.]|nr:hypothetical protein [Enterococcus sp.]